MPAHKDKYSGFPIECSALTKTWPKIHASSTIIQYQLVQKYHSNTGCNDTFVPPPEPKLKVAQYNQTYCRKVESISAMDFQYFYFVSIFTIF